MRPVWRALRGRTVLITGAGGSIGYELCLQIAAVGCKRIVALDQSDHAVIDVLRAVRREFPNAQIQDILCDVRDDARLTTCFERTRPDIVIHAAALKHVHMGDRHPAESVLTNLVGVHNALEASAKAGVDRFLLVSSDKAAAPSSIMGACKRLAELYLHDRQEDLARRITPMRVMSVRFGNVLGSAGSILPIFERQIAAGGPLTITHPDMRRYFMTMLEAVQLILLLCAREDGAGETSSVHLLDMGEPVKIIDVARRMLEAAGLSLPIETCGLREGEKLDEDLCDEFEVVKPSHIDGVLRIEPETSATEVTASDIADLAHAVGTMRDDLVRQRVFALLNARLGQGLSETGVWQKRLRGA